MIRPFEVGQSLATTSLTFPEDDEARSSLACPIISAASGGQSPSPDSSATRAACRDCPLRDRCTAAKAGRTLHLYEHDGLLRAARADWSAGTGLREDYMLHRPHVERVIAQVATWRGRRLKFRYRGTARNHAWLKRRTAAVNLRTLLGRGLARRDGAWVLAT